jgi:predicted amidohydrolase YtcJ
VLVVGDIVTMDPAQPRAEAMAASGGEIVAVGTRADAAAGLPAGAEVHHAPGTVVPGLIDSHVHLQSVGLELVRSEDRLEALRAIQPVVHALGITGIVDPACTAEELAAYTELHRRGELATRVVAMPHPDLGSGVPAAIAGLDALGVRTGLGDDLLRLGGVKVYFDGEGRAGTALRREPWPEGNRGEQRISDADFEAIAAYCARAGWSLGVHVVGGAGIDAVLETFARIDAETPVRGLGFTLIHAYLEPTDANFERAAALGVLVAAQPPIHYANGAGLVQKLGPGAEGANPIAGWLGAGVTVGGGSDAPAFPLDPRLALWQVRTRHVSGADEAHAPELALDAEAALALYTTGAAAVSLAGSTRGRLRPGFLADWVALDVDPLTATPDAVRSLSVLETAIGGRIVYRAG